MPVYALRCTAGHRFEVLQPFSAPLPACACGAETVKVPSVFGVTGKANLPPPAERMPQTWRGTYEGDRGYLRHLRRTAERRRDLEERHPELRGDRRPIAAHEGPYAGAPLRAGDQPAVGGERQAPGGGSPVRPHGHHGHHHPSRVEGGDNTT